MLGLLKVHIHEILCEQIHCHIWNLRDFSHGLPIFITLGQGKVFMKTSKHI